MEKLLLLFGSLFIAGIMTAQGVHATFQNPIFPKSGSDPWIVYKSGYYYYTHTSDGCIKLWMTPDITDIKNAPCKTVWPLNDSIIFDMRAPEIHYLSGKWYIYYSAYDAETDSKQLFVLENENENPCDGEFVMKGRIATDRHNTCAIDASVFEIKDTLYLVWSGWQTRRKSDKTQCVFIAMMDDPWTLSSQRVVISKPELEWERHWMTSNDYTPSGSMYVNEAPQPLLSPDGKHIHVVYSASGSWTPYYALGMLTASVDDNLLDPASWAKSARPVFHYQAKANIFAPGLGAFFQSPDGKEWYILYHARSTETDSGATGNTRSPRIQRFEWDDNGYPVFGDPVSVDVLLAKPSGTPMVVKTYHPAKCPLSTVWGEHLDPNNVLPEYPRPTLVRNEWQNLNGLWKYAVREEGRPCPKAWDGDILVPFCIESALSGVGKALPAHHALWYTRTFSIPSSWKNRHIQLNFGAVDWKAEVFVNGKMAGYHTGGYTPFSIDITPYLNAEGEQTLTVCVTDPSNMSYQPRGKQVVSPKSIWYTSVSGIWQTVWMEPISETAITSVKSIPELLNNTLSVTVSTNTMCIEDKVDISLYTGDTCVAKVSGKIGESITIEIKEPKLWTPDEPYLYDMKVVLNDGVDSVFSYTAMRSIGTVKDEKGIWRMQLNGKKLFQFGPLDQGWWPDGLYTAASDEALIYDIQKTKEMGFNMIRKHVKVEPERWYYHCDRLGVLVWQDMPSGDLGNIWEPHVYGAGTNRERTEDSKANYYKEWEEIMDFCMSHPCIIVWVPFNEAWGQFETEAIAAWTKRHDPSRLVNPASGGNFVDAGDIFDLHHYPTPKLYLYDPDRVNVLGEYGGIGLPIEGHLWWNKRNWGYIKFTNSEEVTAEYVRYAKLLARLVEKGFSAAVYTQISDVEGEVNGLMTYDRKKFKMNIDSVRKINKYVISQLK